MSDSLPIRLGNLATTINRIAVRLDSPLSKDKVLAVVREGQAFIEVTADRLEPERAEELVQGLQITLSRWKRHWDRIWESESERQQVGAVARAWSEKLLDWMYELQEEKS